MFFVRNRISGDVLTCGTDRERCYGTARGSERLEVREDLNAGVCYSGADMIKDGFSWIHPYEYVGRQALQAEFQVLFAWHRAGGNA